MRSLSKLFLLSQAIWLIGFIGAKKIVCPDGWTQKGNTCFQEIVTKAKECPPGFTRQGNTCFQQTTSQSCPEGWTKKGNTCFQVTNAEGGEIQTFETKDFDVEKMLHPETLTAEEKISVSPCPLGWELFNDKCYGTVTSAIAGYDFVQQECEKFGGTLASIHSMAEDRVVTAIAHKAFHIRAGQTKHVYIGATDRDSEGAWVWEDGTPFDWTNWAPNQPDPKTANREHCLAILTKVSRKAAALGWSLDQWDDIHCGGNEGVCQKVVGFQYDLRLNQKTFDTCPEGWIQFENKCYAVASSFTPGYEFVKRECQLMGGQLASVHSSKENGALNSVALKLMPRLKIGARFTYLGATDKIIDGKRIWLWEDGTPFDYESWEPTEPNNAGNQEHCLMLNYNVPKNRRGWAAERWIDQHCLLSHGMCQINLGQQVVPVQPRPAIIRHELKPTKITGGTIFEIGGTKTGLISQTIKYCPRGWGLFGNICYRSSPASNYQQIIQYNIQNGLTLVSITSEEENIQIGQSMQKLLVDTRYAYIGIIYDIKLGKWVWQDGREVKYTNWVNGEEPKNPETKRYAVMVLNVAPGSSEKLYQWVAVDGTEEYPSITEKKVENLYCPKDWMLYEDRCYQVTPTNLGGYEAVLSFINAQGFTLASIGSDEENNFLGELARKAYVTDEKAASFAYIGGRNTEGVWLWEDQTPFEYTNWQDGEPDNSGEFVVMVLNDPSQKWKLFKWVDQEGDKPYGGIMKRRAARVQLQPEEETQVETTQVTTGGGGGGKITIKAFITPEDTYQAIKEMNKQQNVVFASIHSEKQNNLLGQLMRRELVKDTSKTVVAYIGGEYKDGKWVWDDNSEFKFFNWAKGEPKNPETNSHIAIVLNPAPGSDIAQYTWITVTGNEKYPGIAGMDFDEEVKNTGGTTTTTTVTKTVTTYVTPAGSYKDILDYNKKQGTILASFHSDQENKGLGEFMRQTLVKDVTKTTYAYIGLVYRDGKWVWQDNTEFKYTNWAPGEPKNPEKNTHVVMVLNVGVMPGAPDSMDMLYKWITVTGSEKYPGISFNNTNGIVVNEETGTSTVETVETETTEVNDVTAIVTEEQTITEIFKYNEEHQTTLVSIHTEQENKLIGETMRKVIVQEPTKTYFAYIGIKYDTTTKKWVWSDGTPVEYVDWLGGKEPENPEETPYVTMVLNIEPGKESEYQLFKWVAVKGDVKYPAITKPKVEPVVTEEGSYTEIVEITKKQDLIFPTIHSIEENTIIGQRTRREIVKDKTQTVYAYLGIKYSSKEGRWVWEDGSPVKFGNWLNGEEPKNVNENSRVVMVLNVEPAKKETLKLYEWVVVNGDEKYHAITIKKPSEVIKENMDIVRIVEDNNGVTNFITPTVDYKKIIEYNTKHGFTLVSIHTEEENINIGERIRKEIVKDTTKTTFAYIGIHYDTTVKKWVYEDGKEVTYVNWVNGQEPKNPEETPYVTIILNIGTTETTTESYKLYQWIAVKGDEKLPAISRVKREPVVTPELTIKEITEYNKKHGFELISIHTIEENKNIVEIMRKKYVKDTSKTVLAYIGITYQPEQGTWTWKDGTVVNFENWVSFTQGTPKNPNTMYAVVVLNVGPEDKEKYELYKWVPVSGEEKYIAITNLKIETVEKEETNVVKIVEGVNGTSSIITPTNDIKKIREYNIRNDLTLVSIHTEQENKRYVDLMIKELVTDTTQTVLAYIGGKYKPETNEWVWEDNTQFKFVNWMPGEPKNPETKRYVAVVLNVKPGNTENLEVYRWVTVTGDEKYPGISKKVYPVDTPEGTIKEVIEYNTINGYTLTTITTKKENVRIGETMRKILVKDTTKTVLAYINGVYRPGIGKWVFDTTDETIEYVNWIKGFEPDKPGKNRYITIVLNVAPEDKEKYELFQWVPVTGEEKYVAISKRSIEPVIVQPATRDEITEYNFKNGLVLVSVHSEVENEYVVQRMVKELVKDTTKTVIAYIGGMYNPIEGKWTWVDRSSFSYTNFVSEEDFKNPGDKRFIAVVLNVAPEDKGKYTLYKWITVTGTEILPAISKKKVETVFCSAGWTLSGNKCYKPTPEATYKEIFEYNFKNGYTLPSIHTEQTNIFLGETLRKIIVKKETTTTVYSYIGIRYEPTIQKWVWEDNTPVKYTNWLNVEETKNPTKRYVTIILNTEPGKETDLFKWVLVTGDEKYVGISEKKVENIITSDLNIVHVDVEDTKESIFVTPANNYTTIVEYNTNHDLTLVKIISEEQNEFLGKTFRREIIRNPNKPFYAYIGVHYIVKESRWVWEDGTPVIYTNWVNGEEPKNPGPNQYVAIVLNVAPEAKDKLKKYVWMLVSGDEKWPGISKRSIVPTYCSEGYKQFGDFCYKVAPELTYKEIIKFNIENGLELTSIRSEEEYNFIVKIMRETLVTDTTKTVIAYVGGTYDIDLRRWGWTDNTEFKFVTWDKNEPSNPSINKYIAVVLNVAPEDKEKYTLYKWITLNGEEKHPSITKRKADPVFCPLGALLVNNKCYKATPALTYQEIVEYNIDNKFTLVTITTEQANKQIGETYRKILVQDTTKPFYAYIGVHYDITVNKWVYEDGTEVKYVNWLNEEETKNPGDKRYVVIILNTEPGKEKDLYKWVIVTEEQKYTAIVTKRVERVVHAAFEIDIHDDDEKTETTFVVTKDDNIKNINIYNKLNGIELVSITSEEDNTFIGQLIRRAVVKDYTKTVMVYIGAKYLPEQSRWVWMDYSPFEFTQWGFNEPANPDTNRYIAMVVNIAPESKENLKLFKWVAVTGEEDFPGFSKKIVVREVSTTVTIVSTPAAPLEEIYNDEVQKKKYVLVSIDSEDTNNYYGALMRRSLVKDTTKTVIAYIGGFYHVKKGKWVWADYSPFEFTNWVEGEEPQNPGEKRYIAIILNVAPGDVGKYRLYQWVNVDGKESLHGITKRTVEITETTETPVTEETETTTGIPVTEVTTETTTTGTSYFCPSSPDWKRFGQYCYQVVPSGVYSTIIDYNIKNGFAFVTINSVEENNYLGELIRSTVVKDPTRTYYAYIGVVYQPETGKWVWSDGTTIRYANWLNDEEPKNPGDNKYVAMVINIKPKSKENLRLYRWVIVDGEQVFPAVIGKKVKPVTCPSGWLLFGDYCYKTISPRPIREITSSISEYNTIVIDRKVVPTITSVHSEDENNYLGELLRKIYVIDTTKTTYAYIGGEFKDGQWVWQDGTPINFVYWQEGQTPETPRDKKYIAIIINVAPEEEQTVKLYRWVMISGEEAYPTVIKTKIEKVKPVLDDARHGINIYPTPVGDYKTIFEYNLKHGFTLVSIHSEDVNKWYGQFFRKLFVRNNPATMFAYIGIVYQPETGRWVWSDDTPITFTNWQGDEEPKNPGEKRYVAIVLNVGPEDKGKYTLYKWVTVSGEDKYVGISKRRVEYPLEKNHELSILKDYRGFTVHYCPTGWTHFDGYCYQVTPFGNYKFITDYNTKNTFTLTSIHSDKENYYLGQIARRALVKDYRKNYVAYIGIKFVNGEWAWEDGSPVKYFNWLDNAHPTKPRDNQYVAMVLNVAPGSKLGWKLYKWVLVSGEEKHIGIVKRKVEPVYCPLGAIHIGDYCYLDTPEGNYKQVTDFTTEITKKYKSFEFTFQLTSIANEEENNYLGELLRIALVRDPFKTYLVFLGGKVVGHNWAWNDETPFKFINWNVNEPKNAGINWHIGMTISIGIGTNPDWKLYKWVSLNGDEYYIAIIRTRVIRLVEEEEKSTSSHSTEWTIPPTATTRSHSTEWIIPATTRSHSTEWIIPATTAKPPVMTVTVKPTKKPGGGVFTLLKGRK